MSQEHCLSEAFTVGTGISFSIYQTKQKNVLLLSSMYPNLDTFENKKIQETVNFYNHTKYGVDVIDQMVRK